MRRFIGTVARIAFGLALASLAAGLVTVLFVDIDVLAGPLTSLPKTLADTINLALLAATHIGLFSALFVVIMAAIGEFLSIRALAFYLLLGLTMALLGFTAQYASEVAGQATILNNYAIKAFLTIGFVGGFVYWLAAGQFAGRPPEADAATLPATATHSVAAARDDDTGVQVVIAKPPTEYERSRWRMPALERLKFAKRGGTPLPGATGGASTDGDDDDSSQLTRSSD